MNPLGQGRLHSDDVIRLCTDGVAKKGRLPDVGLVSMCFGEQGGGLLVRRGGHRESSISGCFRALRGLDRSRVSGRRSGLD